MSRSTSHLAPTAFRSATGGRLSPAESRHLESCATCRKDSHVALALAAAGACDDPGECPGGTELVRHLDGVTAGEERDRMDDHLMRCSPCSADAECLERASRDGGIPPRAPSMGQILHRAAAGAAEALRQLVLAWPATPPMVLATRSTATASLEPARALARGAELVKEGRGADALAILEPLSSQRSLAVEARFWSAQALLLEGETARALVELDALGRGRTARARDARLLSERVRDLTSHPKA